MYDGFAGDDWVFGAKDPQVAPDSISGIYPRLAYYNQEGECGTGAVVPWADRLWVITYGPHLPNGSSDKLYEITPDYRQLVREESIEEHLPTAWFIRKVTSSLSARMPLIKQEKCG